MQKELKETLRELFRTTGQIGYYNLLKQIENEKD